MNSKKQKMLKVLIITVNKLIEKIQVKDKKINRAILDQFVHVLLAKDFKRADELINNFGPSIININIDGHTPLTLLLPNVSIDPLEQIKYLISKSVDVNIPNKDDLTPLMYAVWRGFVETTKLLIDAGAKKDVKANNGATALTIAQGKSPMPTLQPANSGELIKLVS